MKKGFTLIELLGVIVILGILVLVAFPPLLNQIKKSKSEIKESTKLLIIDAAKDYIEDNKNNFDKIEGITYCININTLIENNYINENLQSENLEKIDQTKKIKMIYHNNKYNYEITENCTNYSLTRNNIEVPIVAENSGLYKSTTDIDRFIYRGGNPINNWIELNEGTDQSPSYIKYRIISFEPDGTIKVVREESLDNMFFDDPDGYETENRNSTSETSYCTSEDGCHIWGNQENTYYNGKSLSELNMDVIGFYFLKSSQNSEPILQQYSIIGKVTEDSTLNKYLNNTWISTKQMKDHITNHSFYVGGLYYNGANIPKDAKTEKLEQQMYTWYGQIGLINTFEYVEASTNPTCTNVFSTYYYNPAYYYDGAQHLTEINDWPCSNTNYAWMNNLTSFYTINFQTPVSYNVWRVASNGPVTHNRTKSASNFIKPRPAFYLKSNITLTGEGSESNPYRIME